MYKTARYQKGVTGLGWLTILMIAGFFVFLGLQIGPIYLEHYSIKAVLHSLEADTSLDTASPRQLRKIIQRRLKINSVYDFDQSNIKIKKHNHQFDIDMSYEVRKPMIYNIDILVTFNDKLHLMLKE